MGTGMIDFLLLATPSFAAGILAMALWQARARNRSLTRANDILRAAIAEASKHPEAFAKRIAALRAPGTRLASRRERIALIAERRRSERAARRTDA